MRFAWTLFAAAVSFMGCSQQQQEEDDDVVSIDFAKESAEQSADDADDAEEAPEAEDGAAVAEADGDKGGEAAVAESSVSFEEMLKTMGPQGVAAAKAKAVPVAAVATTPVGGTAAQASGGKTAAEKVAKTTQVGSAAGTRQLKSEVLAVRAAPSLKAKIVGYIHGDVEVPVVKDGWNGWTKIGPGRFVRSKYLTTGQTKAVGSGDVVYTVKSQVLYIRNAPDHEATVVGIVTNGDKVRGGAASAGWVQLGPKKFVRMRYLEALGH